MKKNPAAVALGQIKTEKKAATSRANGKRGGRPRTKFELVFSGAAMASYFPRYRRNHDTVDSARETAESVRAKLDFRVLGAHHGVVYGPGCGKDGMPI